MAENTPIEWTDHTFNPWIGCTKVGPGCDHCYAEDLMDRRHGRVEWGGDRSRTAASTWALPHRWQRAAPAFLAAHGRRQRVFCASLADVGDNHRSILPAWRADLAATVRATPDLEWLFLTKRIGNMPGILLGMFDATPPENIRIGATIVNQAEWDRDAGKIAQVAVIVGRERIFLSMEPLLGPVDLDHAYYPAKRFVGWVIAGGESGRDARPMHPDWVRGIRGYCAENGIPFLFKQWGEWGQAAGDTLPGDRLLMSWPEGEDGFIRQGVKMRRYGKKAAGRILDGVTHSAFPA